jgi:hypothetical protein
LKLRLERPWREAMLHAPTGVGSSCFGPRQRQRLGRRFQTARGLRRRQDRRQGGAEPPPAKTAAAREERAARPHPAAEWPTARLLKRPCLERKHHAPKAAGSSCFGPRQHQGPAPQFRRARGFRRRQDQCQGRAEPRPAKPDAAPEARAAPPHPAGGRPMGRLLEPRCLEWKRRAPRDGDWSCSSCRERQGQGRPLPATAWRVRRLAGRTAAARQGSSRLERVLRLARTSRWQGASNTPRPAGRRETRPRTPLEDRRP